jgi:sugar phosphate isomerase/epimerase
VSVDSVLPDVIFWPGSMAERGLLAILDAARAGGFPVAAVSPFAIHELQAGDAEELRREAARRGVRLAQFDGVSSWAPVNDVPELPKERFDLPPERVFDLAEAVGVESVLAFGAFGPGTVPVDDLVAAFAAFCDHAAERGLRVELEFVPYWGLGTLALAWDIVRAADRPNGTLMVDTWHVLKSSTEPQAALDLLADIPADKLTGLQLADAPAVRQAATLYAEGRLRRFPGDGELPLHSVVGPMLAKGGVRGVGAEVFGPAIDELQTEAVGRKAAASVRAALAQSM